MPGVERGRPGLGDALRPFVHAKVGADAVARAVIEIEPGVPQRLRAKRVDLRAAAPFGKHGARDGDMALEHAGEAVAHLRGRRARPRSCG